VNRQQAGLDCNLSVKDDDTNAVLMIDAPTLQHDMHLVEDWKSSPNCVHAPIRMSVTEAMRNRMAAAAAVQPCKALGRVQLKGNLVVIVTILDCVDHVSIPATATDTAVASTAYSSTSSSYSVGAVNAAGHTGRGSPRWRRTEAAVDTVFDSLSVAH
jgi:hypothetical protein